MSAGPGGFVRKTIVWVVLVCPFVAVSLDVLGTGTGVARAATPAPYVVALSSCDNNYTAAFGNTYNVRIDVDAYNLPASANGSTVVGVAATPNTTFSVSPDGGAGNPMSITNGAGSGYTHLNLPGGPHSERVTVTYQISASTTASLGSVSVTLPDPAGCGSANVTSVSSVPGTTVGPVVGMASTPDGLGYWMVGSDGRVYAYGEASLYAIPGSGYDFIQPNKPIVGMAVTPDGRGYWLVASDGGIFSFGDAVFYGSTGGTPLNKPIVGMTATAGGKGYWLVASDGGIFAYGDAQFFGSTGSIHLNQPVVGMAADDATGGYWLVASDGGIFSYNAPFLGSSGSIRLNKPIVGMEAAPNGSGYRFVASDGGVFCYGPPFAGSTGSITLNQPITSMAPSGSGGYWLGAADGGIFNFGTGFYGSAA
jgi:hypothetical protein